MEWARPEAIVARLQKKMQMAKRRGRLYRSDRYPMKGEHAMYPTVNAVQRAQRHWPPVESGRGAALRQLHHEDVRAVVESRQQRGERDPERRRHDE